MGDTRIEAPLGASTKINGLQKLAMTAESMEDINIAQSGSTVQVIAIELAEDVARYMVNTSSPVRPANRYATTMRRTVDEVTEKHELVFKNMVCKLDVTSSNVQAVLISVLDEVFADEQYNWGRIVTVYAFAGWTAKYCAENNMKALINTITQTTGLYVAKRLSSWIESNGGWDAFETFFKKPESYEKYLWSGLVCTMVSVGVGALASALLVK